MVHSLHYIDFGVQVLQVETTGEDSLVDDLDSHWLACLNDLAPIDRSIRTLSEEPLQAELILFYSFLLIHSLSPKVTDISLLYYKYST